METHSYSAFDTDLTYLLLLQKVPEKVPLVYNGCHTRQWRHWALLFYTMVIIGPQLLNGMIVVTVIGMGDLLFKGLFGLVVVHSR